MSIMADAPHDIDSLPIGQRCWFEHNERGYVSGELKSKVQSENRLQLRFEDEVGRVHNLDLDIDNLTSSKGDNLPPLRDPATIESHTIQDLIELSNLNTPSVLHAIATRYERQEIYTYSGIVLIAVNPFSRVPLYTDAFIQLYSGKLKTDVQPHLYGIAEDAYRCMRREAKNQTIIVSGESGAGKTVSAKYIMRYFATVEDADKPKSRREVHASKDGMSRTEEQIIATNPIMEAFGNAKTTRNDNSSRFGKFIEIMFDKQFDIIGAQIRTYLLERSRLSSQALTERNYHVFYQLCIGLDAPLRSELGLTDCMQYRYLSQGECSTISGVDDREDFVQLAAALAVIGIDQQMQTSLWHILAAILHLGNAEISAVRDNAVLSSEDEHLKKACELLGVEPVNFAKWIVKQSRKLMRENIESPRTAKDALVVRDSIAKYLYNNIFQWLVQSINQVLAPESVRTRTATFIGVLDIYGFEHFKTNSFEQFCINYANEKLQQEFTAHVFKLEQEEYVREAIPWQMIDFADNQACISMIEDRTNGILAILDEQSRLGSGTDSAFRQTLVDKMKTLPHFDVPKLQPSAFTVQHYALPVTYESEGFLEKNRDTVSDQHLEALCNSSNKFVREILNFSGENSSVQSEAHATESKKPRSGRKPTLGFIFKSSLTDLMETIGGTNAHYIRCIKPNEHKKAWEFEPRMVLGQLTACGVLETIRISCAGYPSRWTFLELVERYYCLLPSHEWEALENHRRMSESILRKSAVDPKSYQIGLTKIFFKPGVLAELENGRLRRLHQCATIIQKNAKMWSMRLKYSRLRKVTIAVQTHSRASLARLHYLELRQQNLFTIKIQCIGRAYLARQRAQNQLSTMRIVTIQALARAHLVRALYDAQKRAALIMQKHRRGKIGRREAQRVKRDRGTVEAFKQKNSGLEQKIVSQAQELQKHKNELLDLQSQIVSMSLLVEQGDKLNKLKDQTILELEETNKTSTITSSEGILKLQSEISDLTARLSKNTRDLEQMSNQSNVYVEKLDSQQKMLAEALAEIDVVRKEKTGLQQLVSQLQNDIQRLTGGLGGLNGHASLNGQVFSNGVSIVARGRILPRLEGVHDSQNVTLAIPVQHDSQYSDFESEPNLTDQIMSILEDDDLMNNEVMYGMIQSLKIPQPSLQTPPLDVEVLFPAQLINIIVSEMWKLGYVKESERFLANVMQSIQQQVMSYEGEDAINPGAFWLSNVHEILSFVWLAEADILNSEQTQMSEMEWQEYDRLLSIVKHDLESLEFNIYHTWMKELKKRLYRMIIPATIESQSLPGFITSENSRFFNKLLQGNAPQINMDDLLNHFNKVYKAMKSFYLEDTIIIQTMTELLKLVGVTAFNDLLMRRNFLSWKRGLQINYNITRIEEWCKSHDMPEGTLQLEHLMQATKLLQLKKATIADIDILYDICWCLSNRQIHKLINQYYPADYENPLSPEILKAVASRVTPEETQEILLDAVALDDSGAFEIADARDIKLVTPHVPGYLSLLRMKTLLSLIERQSQIGFSGSVDVPAY